VTAPEYDVILVGSGTCGATIARELARGRKKVLILEQGADVPLKETLAAIAAIAREYPVGNNLKAATGVTVGGSTSLYFSVCKLPTPGTFAQLGIDLSGELAQVQKELPIAELPDAFLPPQSLKIQESAAALGYRMKKNRMLVDQASCTAGKYSFQAKWKAKTYITDALQSGAELITGATVQKVLVENGRAVGVEYRCKWSLFGGFMRSRTARAYGRKIVLSAGALATAKLLINCGISNVGDRGFFCKPAYMVCGIVRGLQGKDAFLGGLDVDLGNGVFLGDGTMNAVQFKMVMLANFKWRHLFSHADILSVGILIADSMGGAIGKDGRYYKQLTAEELVKLRTAEQIAIQILEHAGARNIFRTRLVAGIPGGALRVNDHVDQDLQTRIHDLYVCDHSLISDVTITPTVTLICLGRYLAKRLLASLEPSRTQSSAACVAQLAQIS
jgi:hypothetical protein